MANPTALSRNKLSLSRTVDRWVFSAIPDSWEGVFTGGTATATVPLFVATQRVIVRGANFVFGTSPVGTTLTLQLANATQGWNVTLASSNIAAGTINVGNAFVLNNALNGGADSNLLIKPLDVITLVYTATAITTGAGQVVIQMEVKLTGIYK